MLICSDGWPTRNKSMNSLVKLSPVKTDLRPLTQTGKDRMNRVDPFPWFCQTPILSFVAFLG